MLVSIKHCHDRNIVHRDVKLENFLMDTNSEDKLIVKLSDFGLACKYDAEQPPTQKCGSLVAIAPEILSSDSYCHKIDVWALGVILHEMLTT